MSNEEDTIRAEDWILVPKDERSLSLPTDLDLNGRHLTGAIIQAGCRARGFSTVVTSERYVGSIDVVAHCLALNREREIVRRTPVHQPGLGREDEDFLYPCAIKVRLTIPRGEARSVAAGFMASATVFPGGESLPFEDFAAAVRPHELVEGCVVIAATANWEALDGSLDRMYWAEDHVRFLAGLLDYPGLIESLTPIGEEPREKETADQGESEGDQAR